MIGKKFMGRYEIVSKLGSGGMAVVYKALDTVLNRRVTVKILQEQFSSNQQFVIRFRKEAQAVAALSSHPNIVNVYDVGCSEEGEHYLIMEYVEGKTLKEVIKKKGSLTVKESLDYTNQILAGLSHAHSYGVIHRDIKPQNIMITTGNQVKIMDFGLALNLSDSTMTYDSSVFGSVYYIAPEIAQKGTGDARADIYSTGIVLYEMLTGELPFNGDSPITIALQHVEGEFDSVDDIDDEIPYEVARVVDKAMSVDPGERYATAKGMMRDIKNAADENDIPLKPIPVIAGAAALGNNPGNTDNRSRRDSYADEDDYDVDFEEEYRDSRRKDRKPERKSTRGSSSKGRKKTNKKKIILLVALAIVVLSAGIFAAYSAFSNTGDEVEVPLLVGQNVDDAKEILDELEIKYEINYTESEDVEVDEVISQSIDAGQKIKTGRTIELTVSTGVDSVEVPSVVGKSEKSAKKLLTSAGFEVEVETESSDEVDEDEVISQDPAGGGKAPKGSTVTIVVSSGPENKEVTVPDVVGLTLSDAKSQLTSADLRVGSVTEKYSSAEAGEVTYQSVKGGTKVSEGTTVNLTVSKGPEEKPDEPDEPSDNKAKTTTYSHQVSDNYESAVPVQIVVQDSKGESTAYSGNCDPGKSVSVSITYYPPAIIFCYENGSLVDQQSY